MRSLWKKLGDLEPDAEYLVLASAIPTRHLPSTWRMSRGARAVRKQLTSTDGIVGFSLLARPLRKQYATLSVWTDQEALNAFVHASPHSELTSGLAPGMGPPASSDGPSPGPSGAHPGPKRCDGSS